MAMLHVVVATADRIESKELRLAIISCGAAVLDVRRTPLADGGAEADYLISLSGDKTAATLLRKLEGLRGVAVKDVRDVS